MRKIKWIRGRKKCRAGEGAIFKQGGQETPYSGGDTGAKTCRR